MESKGHCLMLHIIAVILSKPEEDFSHLAYVKTEE